MKQPIMQKRVFWCVMHLAPVIGLVLFSCMMLLTEQAVIWAVLSVLASALATQWIVHTGSRRLDLWSFSDAVGGEPPRTIGLTYAGYLLFASTATVPLAGADSSALTLLLLSLCTAALFGVLALAADFAMLKFGLLQVRTRAFLRGENPWRVLLSYAPHFFLPIGWLLSVQLLVAKQMSSQGLRGEVVLVIAALSLILCVLYQRMFGLMQARIERGSTGIGQR